jgi:hypothetical protein
MGELDDLVSRYLDLYRQFGHAPRRGDRPTFNKAQRELWQLAQAICTLAHPKIQAELDAARRDVMAQVRLHIENIGPVVVRPKHHSRPVTWAEFQLTPELSMDMNITGASVTKDVARRLREAHRQQISAIYAIAHKAR